MLKSMMISCKKATFLISKKEEHKLSFGERIHLLLHLSMCQFCKRFEIQSRFISLHSHHMISSAELSHEDKETMVQILQNHSRE